MKNNNHRTVRITEANPNNPSHWVSHNEWLKIVAKGAPQPSTSSAFWNDWAANNPSPQAIALMGLNVAASLKSSLLNPRGILGSAARPIEPDFSEVVSWEEYGNNL